jgi:hypothetical protein
MTPHGYPIASRARWQDSKIAVRAAVVWRWMTLGLRAFVFAHTESAFSVTIALSFVLVHGGRLIDLEFNDFEARKHGAIPPLLVGSDPSIAQS